MLDDLLSSAKDSLLERIASPLIGSFVVAWPLWNYKFLVILFSDNDVTTTFHLIEQIAFPDAWAVISRGIAFPLLSTLAYVFLYPYPAKLVYGFVRRRQVELNELKLAIESAELLSVEQSRVLRATFRERLGTLQRELDRVTEENEGLKRVDNVAGETPVKVVASNVRKPSDESALTEEDLEALVAFSKIVERTGRPVDDGALAVGIKSPKVKAQYLIDRLSEGGFLRYSGSQGYSLTTDGRRVVVERERS